jgi:hypothetical protein
LKRPAPPAEGHAARPPVESPFRVPLVLHVLGDAVARHPAFWARLGRFETRVLSEELERIPLRAPLYVCGLARSGSTLLHEVVADHPGVATHRSKDFPMVFTPYWWRRATAGLPPGVPRERPHADGVTVTTESPDALEEMVWAAFFPDCHRPAVSAVLGAGDRHPEFESFYDRHVRKLMLAEGATRYAAKNNYHVARLSYLARLRPDARFLLPVRAPADHVASLVRQQRLFSAGQRAHPRALAYMRRSGHFEFGLDRRPINLGDGGRVRAIQSALADGDEVGGLARYWDMVYGHVWRVLESDPAVRRASVVVRYEDVAAEPEATLRTVLRHCELPEADAVAGRHAPRVRRPTSDPAVFSAAERAAIRDITAATARLWGYE